MIPNDVTICNENVTSLHTIPEIKAHNSITIQQTRVYRQGEVVLKAGSLINVNDAVQVDSLARMDMVIDPALR